MPDAFGTGRHAMAIDPFDFRQALGRFASGVTVVTVRNGEAVQGITVSAFLSLSLEPPLVGIAIDHGARVYGALLSASSYCVSMLAEDQAQVADHFAARPVDPGADPFVPFHGLAAIRGAIAHLGCRVVRRVSTGDHDLIVGEIEHLAMTEGRPLLYFRSQYRRMG